MADVGTYEDGIPDDWEYIDDLPVAWIRDMGMSMQELCPYCAYAEGYNEPLIMVNLKREDKVCPKCHTKFMGYGYGNEKGVTKKARVDEAIGKVNRTLPWYKRFVEWLCP